MEDSSKWDYNSLLCDLERAGEFVLGQGDVSRIVLCRDGAGPMGWYDRIHIMFDGETDPGRTMPAHMVESWG